MPSFVRPSGLHFATLVLAVVSLAAPLCAQSTIDPKVAPRAAALERAGERQAAIDLLGRYLASAPDDGQAWLQLGRLYLAHARDWHLRGHRGNPDGSLYLDFAVIALDQAVRLAVDSGAVVRGLVELERALNVLEESGWEAARSGRVQARTGAPALPEFVVDTGVKLRGACAPNAVLVTGTDLEALAVWYSGLQDASSDIIPIRPGLYIADSRYRRRMAAVLGADPSLPIRQALAAAAERRPVCLAPGADSALAVPQGRGISGDRR